MAPLASLTFEPNCSKYRLKLTQKEQSNNEGNQEDNYLKASDTDGVSTLATLPDDDSFYFLVDDQPDGGDQMLPSDQSTEDNVQEDAASTRRRSFKEQSIVAASSISSNAAAAVQLNDSHELQLPTQPIVATDVQSMDTNNPVPLQTSAEANDGRAKRTAAKGNSQHSLAARDANYRTDIESLPVPMARKRRSSDNKVTGDTLGAATLISAASPSGPVHISLKSVTSSLPESTMKRIELRSRRQVRQAQEEKESSNETENTKDKE